MRQRFAPAVLMMIALSSVLHGQLTIRITSLPAVSPANPKIYVAGSFQNWVTGDENYRFTNVNGTWMLTFPDNVRGAIQFKFQRGTWWVEEATAGGDPVATRQYTIPATGVDTLNVSIIRWKDAVTWPASGSTAGPGVSLLDYWFYLPQLDVTHRVWLYLPPDYNSTSKSYPVIYAPDGQFLFDDKVAYYTSPAQFWGEGRYDEMLDSLQAAGDWGAIVVGVDFDPYTRSNEYFPWLNPNDGAVGDKGDEYAAFLATTLKPYIDAHYRTIPAPASTGIIGYSAGASMAFYAAMRYPDVFGLVGVCSPAFYFATDKIYDTAAVYMNPATMHNKLYFLSSQVEVSPTQPELGAIFGPAHLRMVDTLVAKGYVIGQNLRSESRPSGEHRQWFWIHEFAEMYTWLYSAAAVTAVKDGTVEVPGEMVLHQNYPNPFNPSTEISYSVSSPSHVSIRVFDMLGRAVADLVNEHVSSGGHAVTWDASNVPSGVYVCRLDVTSMTGISSSSMKRMVLIR